MKKKIFNKGQVSFESLIILLVIITFTIILSSFFLNTYNVTNAYTLIRSELLVQSNQKNENVIIQNIFVEENEIPKFFVQTIPPTIDNNYFDLKKIVEKIGKFTNFKNSQIILNNNYTGEPEPDDPEIPEEDDCLNAGTIPVCGLDGNTYDNRCYAIKAGTDTNYLGKCGKPLIDPDKPTPPFTFQIKTTKNNEQFQFIIYGAQGMEVDWGLGQGWVNLPPGDTQIKTYPTPGDYNISLKGKASRISFENSGEMLKDIHTPVSNSVTGLTSARSMFANTTLTQVSCPDFFDDASKNITNMEKMFANSRFNQNINNWNTGNVTNMNGMFSNSQFNGNISNWNTSNVTNMASMFGGATFNQDISNWNTSNVTTMSEMFNSSKFNQDISNWNTSKVTNMFAMFVYSDFNQPINNWNTSSVTNMQNMFWAAKFNHPINDWNTINVTNMQYMFIYSPYNYPLNNWDTRNVTNMFGMFYGSKFNQNINNWDTSKVTNMYAMFHESQFNGHISDWNTSNVTNMASMFDHSKFNQDISNWNTSNVTTMENMFSYSDFNQPIENWNTRNVTTMKFMFWHSKFNHPINDWNTINVTNMEQMFSDSQFNQDINKWNVSKVIKCSWAFSYSPLENQPLKQPNFTKCKP